MPAETHDDVDRALAAFGVAPITYINFHNALRQAPKALAAPPAPVPPQPVVAAVIEPAPAVQADDIEPAAPPPIATVEPVRVAAEAPEPDVARVDPPDAGLPVATLTDDDAVPVEWSDRLVIVADQRGPAPTIEAIGPAVEAPPPAPIASQPEDIAPAIGAIPEPAIEPTTAPEPAAAMPEPDPPVAAEPAPVPPQAAPVPENFDARIDWAARLVAPPPPPPPAPVPPANRRTSPIEATSPRAASFTEDPAARIGRMIVPPPAMAPQPAFRPQTPAESAEDRVARLGLSHVRMQPVRPAEPMPAPSPPTPSPAAETPQNSGSDMFRLLSGRRELEDRAAESVGVSRFSLGQHHPGPQPGAAPRPAAPQAPRLPPRRTEPVPDAPPPDRADLDLFRRL